MRPKRVSNSSCHCNRTDRAVVDAYGWHDLVPTHEFLLDYDDEADAPRTRRRKKPWRYRWPDEFRDEVLMRLLRLNHERAEEEKLHLPAPKEKRGRKKTRERTGDLFGTPPSAS